MDPRCSALAARLVAVVRRARLRGARRDLAPAAVGRAITRGLVLAALGVDLARGGASRWSICARSSVRVHLDASEEPLMVRGDPAREVYRRATQTFGNDDVFVIAMVTRRRVHAREPLGAAPHQPRGAAPARRAARREPGGHPHLPLRRRPRTGSTSRASSATRSRAIRRCSPTCARARSRTRSTRSWSSRATARPRRSTSRSTRSATASSSTAGSTTQIRAIAEAEAAPNRAFHFAGPAAREVAHRRDHGARSVCA